MPRTGDNEKSRLGRGKTAMEGGRPRIRSRRALSIQPPGLQVGLVPAEVMPQLVQVRDPHLLAKDVGIALGVVPEVVQEKQNLRRQRLRSPGIGVVRLADEEAEDVRLPALREDGIVGAGFETYRHLAGLRAHRQG